MSYAILIIEDETVLAKKIAKYLKINGFESKIAGTAEDGLKVLSDFQPDAVVLDFNLPGKLNGIACLNRIRAIDENIQIIMITGQGSERIAVDAMKAGAFDYLSKPIVLSELQILLERSIRQQQNNGQLAFYHDKSKNQSSLDHIVGESVSIQQFKKKVLRIIKATDRVTSGVWPSVLISGETGTGKELVARALHFSGERSNAPFIDLNVASIPSHLVESELFGYERGAFTDARSRKLGLVEAANGGTLFLDEIGEMELTVQAKLLRLLEDRMVRRLGSVRDHPVNIQVITATNRSLVQMVEAGRFRQDLYYRLNTLTLNIPPLRERDVDILLLASYFLNLFSKKYGNHHLTLAKATNDHLLTHSWPGNVRELRNVMEQATLNCEGHEILPEHLNIFTNDKTHNKASTLSQTQAQLDCLPELDMIEKNMIIKALNDAHGNVSKAARLLNISRDRLRYRIDKYHLGH